MGEWGSGGERGEFSVEACVDPPRLCIPRLASARQARAGSWDGVSMVARSFVACAATWRAVSPTSAARCAKNDSLSSFPPFPQRRHPTATPPRAAFRREATITARAAHRTGAVIFAPDAPASQAAPVAPLPSRASASWLARAAAAPWAAPTLSPGVTNQGQSARNRVTNHRRDGRMCCVRVRFQCRRRRRFHCHAQLFRVARLTPVPSLCRCRHTKHPSGRDRRTRGRRTVFVKAGTGGRHDINTASIEHHSGMNSRCRVTGSSTLEPRQHHSTQENGPSKASRVSIRSSGAPRLGSRASLLAWRPARPTDPQSAPRHPPRAASAGSAS